MKRLCAFLSSGLLMAGSGVAMASSGSLNEFPSRVLPVLVQVDSHGKVTDVSPSIALAPQFDRLLRQTLDEMINKPADDHGRPVASQFVINLALRTSPRADGAYDAQFAYVSTLPVPSGSWYWAHIDGHRLALVNRNARPEQRRPLDRIRDWNRTPQQYPSERLPAAANPPVQQASHGSARPAAGHPGR